MTREEIKKYLFDNGYPTGSTLNNPRSKHSHIFPYLEEITSFLDNVYEDVKNTSRCFCIIYDLYEVPVCSVCGGFVKIGTTSDPDKTYYYKSGFTKFCSKKCASVGTIEKRKNTYKEKTGYEHQMLNPEVKLKVDETNKEKYGAKRYISTKEHQDNYRENYKEKTGYDHHLSNPEIISGREKSNIEKYGSPNAFQFSKDSIKKTMNERYGVDFPLQNEDILEKTYETNTERYGVKYPIQNEDIKESVRITNLARYNQLSPNRSHFSDYATSVLFNKDKLKDLYDSIPNIHKIAEHLGIGCGRTVLLAMNRLGIETNDAHRVSSSEIEICKFLEEIGVDYVTSNRSLIAPKELDVYIPSHNIAIEFNGTYWHSDHFKDKKYHQDKSIQCMNIGIKLIHIYQDQWENPNKRKIIEEKLSSLLGKSKADRIYARKCKVYEIHQSDTKNFYNSNHIQGYNGCSLNYGLYHDDNLVACIGFKYMGNGSYDLVRYATSCNVIGGFGKLWTHFKRHVEFYEVFTYASLDYSHGEVYEKLGFVLDYVTEPNYFYVDKDGLRYSRQHFMKSKLEYRLDAYDPSLTEKQNVKNNGYYLIHDSGSLKYSYKK